MRSISLGIVLLCGLHLAVSGLHECGTAKEAYKRISSALASNQLNIVWNAMWVVYKHDDGRKAYVGKAFEDYDGVSDLAGDAHFVSLIGLLRSTFCGHLAIKIAQGSAERRDMEMYGKVCQNCSESKFASLKDRAFEQPLMFLQGLKERAHSKLRQLSTLASVMKEDTYETRMVFKAISRLIGEASPLDDPEDDSSGSIEWVGSDSD